MSAVSAYTKRKADQEPLGEWVIVDVKKTKVKYKQIPYVGQFHGMFDEDVAVVSCYTEGYVNTAHVEKEALSPFNGKFKFQPQDIVIWKKKPGQRYRVASTYFDYTGKAHYGLWDEQRKDVFKVEEADLVYPEQPTDIVIAQQQFGPWVEVTDPSGITRIARNNGYVGGLLQIVFYSGGAVQANSVDPIRFKVKTFNKQMKFKPGDEVVDNFSIRSNQYYIIGLCYFDTDGDAKYELKHLNGTGSHYQKEKEIRPRSYPTDVVIAQAHTVKYFPRDIIKIGTDNAIWVVDAVRIFPAVIELEVRIMGGDRKRRINHNDPSIQAYAHAAKYRSQPIHKVGSKVKNIEDGRVYTIQMAMVDIGYPTWNYYIFPNKEDNPDGYVATGTFVSDEQSLKNKFTPTDYPIGEDIVVAKKVEAQQRPFILLPFDEIDINGNWMEIIAVSISEGTTARYRAADVQNVGRTISEGDQFNVLNRGNRYKQPLFWIGDQVISGKTGVVYQIDSISADWGDGVKEWTYGLRPVQGAETDRMVYNPTKPITRKEGVLLKFWRPRQTVFGDDVVVAQKKYVMFHPNDVVRTRNNRNLIVKNIIFMRGAGPEPLVIVETHDGKDYSQDELKLISNHNNAPHMQPLLVPGQRLYKKDGTQYEVIDGTISRSDPWWTYKIFNEKYGYDYIQDNEIGPDQTYRIQDAHAGEDIVVAQKQPKVGETVTVSRPDGDCHAIVQNINAELGSVLVKYTDGKHRGLVQVCPISTLVKT